MKSTKNNPKLNVKLLRRIQKHILEEPRRFFMGWFVVTGDPGKPFKTDFEVSDLADTAPACGTAACIAGWANMLSGSSPGNADDPLLARSRLGLDENSDAQLFGVHAWPAQFREPYRNAKTPATRAKIACARIDHLIKTGK